MRSVSSRIRMSTFPLGACRCIYTELIRTPTPLWACRASPSAVRDRATTFNVTMMLFLVDLQRRRALHSKCALHER